MKTKVSAVLLAFAVLAPVLVTASASPKAVAVLAVERGWLAAIKARDVKALGKLLAENYVHVDASGRLFHREGEIADIKSGPPTTETWGDQTVDFAGDAAIVHGVSTSVENGKKVRQRYIDVYQFAGGRWQALSAQETLVR